MQVYNFIGKSNCNFHSSVHSSWVHLWLCQIIADSFIGYYILQRIFIGWSVCVCAWEFSVYFSVHLCVRSFITDSNLVSLCSCKGHLIWLWFFACDERLNESKWLLLSFCATLCKGWQLDIDIDGHQSCSVCQSCAYLCEPKDWNQN